MFPQTIVIVVPPPGVAYPFILDVQGYPGTIINLFIVLVSAHTLYVYAPNSNDDTGLLHIEMA